MAYPEYPYYLVHPFTGKVLSGWDYKADAHEARADAVDDGMEPVQVLTGKTIERRYGKISWADNGFRENLRRNSRKRNPAYIADLRWRDLPALAPVVMATLKDPVAMIEAAAKGVNPNVRTTPYAAMFADKFPPLPVLDLWCWAYLNTSPLNGKDEQKRAERALKASTKAGLNPLRTLYAVLAVLSESTGWLDLKVLGDSLSHSHTPRRKAFITDMMAGRRRGLDLPDWGIHDVDEFVQPNVQDSIKAAMREFEQL